MKPRLLRTLHHHQTGAAAIEFALVTPVLLFVLMGMLNLAQMVFGQAVLTGEVQTAARSGSLDGTSTTAAETKIKNALKPILVSVSGVTTSRQSYRDFSDIGRADTIHFGDAGRGRVILTSLQVDPATKAQTIGWRRCGGTMNQATAYPSVTASGLGSGTSKVTAAEGSAVMFVEVYYLHKGLFGTLFFNNRTLSREAAFIVKDKRNMTAAPTGTNTTAC